MWGRELCRVSKIALSSFYSFTTLRLRFQTFPGTSGFSATGARVLKPNLARGLAARRKLRPLRSLRRRLLPVFNGEASDSHSQPRSCWEDCPSLQDERRNPPPGKDNQGEERSLPCLFICFFFAVAGLWYILWLFFHHQGNGLESSFGSNNGENPKFI